MLVARRWTAALVAWGLAAATAGSQVFDPPVQVFAGPAPLGLAAADFDGDGLTDLAVVNATTPEAGSVTIMRNSGGGFLSPVQTVSTLIPLPGSIAAGDIDGDGDIDLVVGFVALGSHNVIVIRNRGADFAPVSEAYEVGSSPVKLLLVDVDGDGHPDLVTGNSNTHDLTIRRNNGAGVFSQRQDVPLPADEYNVLDVAAADLDGDGDLDLATANSGSGTTTVFINDGAGRFTPAATLFVGIDPDAITAADLDGDGHPDLAVAIYSGNSFMAIGQVSILWNQGDGAFAAQTVIPGGPVTNPTDLLARDFDGDGRPDLLVVNSADRCCNGAIPAASVSLHRNLGSRLFERAEAIQVGLGPQRVAAADLTGDGQPDAAVTVLGGAQVALLVNSGTVPACRADFNASGAVSVQDLFDYLAAFFTGSPSADFNGTDGVSLQDLFDFLAAWFAGC